MPAASEVFPIQVHLTTFTDVKMKPHPHETRDESQMHNSSFCSILHAFSFRETLQDTDFSLGAASRYKSHRKSKFAISSPKSKRLESALPPPSIDCDRS